MPQSILDLGRMVKQKHPEYADLADDEVGRKVKGKFPGAYDDFMDAPAAPHAPIPAQLSGPPDPPRPGFLETAASDVMGLPSSIYHSLTSPPPLAASMNPAISKPAMDEAYELSQHPIMPSYGEMAGHAVGSGVNMGLTSLLAEGLESPRFHGAVKGAVVNGLKRMGAREGFWNTLTHTIPDVYAGAKEGMSGKLPLGPAGRAVRDSVLPAPPTEYSGRPSTMSLDVGQYSAGAHPIPPPVEVGGAHIPSLTLPEFGSDGWPLPSPAEMQQKLSALPPTSGPTAPSSSGSARFTKGQYDYPRPKMDLSDRMERMLAPVPPPAAAVPPAALPTTSPILPGVETPPGAPAASPGGYAFTHPTGSMADLRKQLFATGQELELPGSPAKTRATQQIRDSSMDVFGKSVSNLEHGELYKLNDFVAKHKRLPTRADLDLMGRCGTNH